MAATRKRKEPEDAPSGTAAPRRSGRTGSAAVREDPLSHLLNPKHCPEQLIAALALRIKISLGSCSHTMPYTYFTL
eukprot:6570387-Pyramimonas_sp.AAC.1